MKFFLYFHPQRGFVIENESIQQLLRVTVVWFQFENFRNVREILGIWENIFKT